MTLVNHAGGIAGMPTTARRNPVQLDLDIGEVCLSSRGVGGHRVCLGPLPRSLMQKAAGCRRRSVERDDHGTVPAGFPSKESSHSTSQRDDDVLDSVLSPYGGANFPAAVRHRSNRRPTNVHLLAYGRFRHGTDEKGKPTANWRPGHHPKNTNDQYFRWSPWWTVLDLNQ